MLYRRRTFPAQSGALENIGRRETKFGLATIPAVRSFSRRSPQILGIFAAEIWGREICLRAKWRSERVWNPTVSGSKSLILLDLDFHKVPIPRADPRYFSEVRLLFIPWITRQAMATSPRGVHSTVRAGRYANPTGFAAHAGAESAPTQTQGPLDGC